jgi:DNA repair protein RecO (recombination protein O)
MVRWTDTGVVLSLARKGERYQIANIFTEEHGRMPGMIHLSHNSKMAIFSKVGVEYNSKTEYSIGFWRKESEKQRWIYLMNSQIHLLICQSVCHILNRVLPAGFQYKSLFRFIDDMSCGLCGLSVDESLSLYAYFEFLLLNTIGFGFDVGNCDTCGQVEAISYISRSTCGCVSNRSPHAVGVDDLLKIPNCWSNWTAPSTETTVTSGISMSDLECSLEITGLFLREHAGVRENHFRESILKLVQ